MPALLTLPCRSRSAACKPDVVKPVSYEDYIVLHKARRCAARRGRRTHWFRSLPRL
jgi:hypothetical protein